VPARSFLRKAVDEHQPELQAKMAEIIERGLRRELAKQGLDPEDLVRIPRFSEGSRHRRRGVNTRRRLQRFALP
jgi:hypothetical protein